jgi:hypothetical protein
VRTTPLRDQGMTWDCVDLELGEIKVEHGRVLLDGHRTATDDPKSTASRRTAPVEGIHAGTVALLRALRARQARDRLMLGAGLPRDRPRGRQRSGRPYGLSCTQTGSGSCVVRPGSGSSTSTMCGTRWPGS